MNSADVGEMETAIAVPLDEYFSKFLVVNQL
jgi:hypothetical protein